MKVFSFLVDFEFLHSQLGAQLELDCLKNEEEFLARKSEINILLCSKEGFENYFSLIKRFLLHPQMLVLIGGEGILKNLEKEYSFGLNFIDSRWDNKTKLCMLAHHLSYINKQKKYFLGLNNTLEPIIAKVDEELHKVKKLHEHILPKRFSNIKGIDIAAKYDAGSSGGGEFFDVLRSQNELLILMSSCRSYLSSSVVLQHFSTLASKKSYDEKVLDDFEKHCFKDLKSSGLDPFQKDYSVKLLLIHVDLNKLQAEARVFGSYFIQSRNKLISSGNSFEFCPEFSNQVRLKVSIAPGDRLVLLSPGLIDNLGGKMNDIEVHQFIPRLSNKSAHDAVNEILFQIHQTKNGRFLKYDSSAIVMDIEGTKIYEV